MKLSELVQQQKIEVKTEQKPVAPVSPAPRRRYFWDEEEQTQAPVPAPIPVEVKKVEPNISQSEVKLEPEVKPKLVQSSAKVEPNQSQEKPALEKLEPYIRPKLSQNLSQSSAKVEPKTDFEELVGLQKNLLIHLFEMCVRTGSRITPQVAISNLAISLETTVSAGRKAIQRLEEKGFIVRSSYKDGRGGWTKYEVKEEVYKTLLLSGRNEKLEPNISQSRAKVGTQLEPQPEPTVPCSSSSLKELNNTTTTEEPLWLNIPENLKGQVPVNQIRAMVKAGTIDSEAVEDSLWGFAHDLEKGLVKSKTGNTTAILIGALKKGGYISQQYLTAKRSEVAEVEKRAGEIKALEEKLEQNRLVEEFENFRAKFPEEAETLRGQLGSFVKNFEPNGMGYRLWVDEFKKHRVKKSAP